MHGPQTFHSKAAILDGEFLGPSKSAERLNWLAIPDGFNEAALQTALLLMAFFLLTLSLSYAPQPSYRTASESHGLRRQPDTT